MTVDDGEAGQLKPPGQALKASVVVPTFNQARYLPACLDSIWFQEYPDLEIIVVNDGSTDHTAEMLTAYQRDVAHARASYASNYNADAGVIERTTHDRYPKAGRNLRVLSHEHNKGLATALNTGFQACTGVYCTYVPSDDICFPHMMAALAQALERHDADFAYADMMIHDKQRRTVRRFSLPDYSFERCFKDWYLCGVAKLYRRDLHDCFGYYDENLLAHDHDLFQRFAMGGARFVHVSAALMSVLDHAGDRQVNLHSPANWNRLLEESCQLVRQAREAASGQRPEPATGGKCNQ